MESHQKHKINYSRDTEPVKGKTYLQATFDDLEDVVLEKNDTLYGDAFNN